MTNVLYRHLLGGAVVLTAVSVTASIAMYERMNDLASRVQRLEDSGKQQGVARPRTAIPTKALATSVQLPTGSPLSISLANAPALGSANAHYALVEYADFSCPFCKRYALETLPRIRQAYVDSGRIVYAFKEFPLERLHPSAKAAATIAMCAAQQGRFWPVHDDLFADAQLLHVDRGMLGSLGVRPDDFERCLRASEWKDQLNDDIGEARAFGMSGTPAFVIAVRDHGNVFRPLRRIVGAQSFEAFATVLDAVMAQQH